MPNEIVRGPRRRRLVNAAMDAYLKWRDECSAVSDAYRRWSDADKADVAVAWQVYEAALAREVQASASYADLVQRVRDLGSPDREPGAELGAAGTSSPTSSIS